MQHPVKGRLYEFVPGLHNDVNSDSTCILFGVYVYGDQQRNWYSIHVNTMLSARVYYAESNVYTCFLCVEHVYTILEARICIGYCIVLNFEPSGSKFKIMQ